METQDINSFVLEQIRSGANKKDIEDQLLSVGWSEDEIDYAYAQALIENGVPVPKNITKGRYAKKTSMVDIMINFFSFILLGIVVTALGSLYFAIINYFLPDALRANSSYAYSYYYRNIAETIHYATAALLIAYPIYYFAVRLWFKAFREDETKVESKLTKWITYLILLASSVTIVGDLIYVIYGLLQGELTMPVLLKALVIIIIASMITGFYYLERKKVQYKKDIPRSAFKLFGYFLSAFVLLGIVLGFVATGSPSTERMRGFDRQRAEDLSEISRCVNRYANEFGALPQTLDDFEKVSNLYCSIKKDPETKQEYEYNIISKMKKDGVDRMKGEIELCAVFSLDSSNDKIGDIGGGYYANNLKWQTHNKGRSCDREKIIVKKSINVVPVSQAVFQSDEIRVE